MNINAKKNNQSIQILNKALDCISAKGYANTSMRDIADEAGVALSQLNYHYKNKEGLFYEVIDMTMNAYLCEIEAHTVVGKTSRERMRYFIRYFREMLSENPKLFMLLYDFTSMALWMPKYAERLNLLFSDIAKLIERGILFDDHLTYKNKKYSSETIARMLSGAIFGIAIQVFLNPYEKDLPNAMEAIELIFE